MSKKGTNERLVYLVLIMMVVGIAISCYTLWYSVRNRNAFEREFRQSLIAGLAKYNFPEDKEITVDEAKLYLAVAKYCESRNSCVGLNGSNGRDGADGSNGSNGSDGANGLDGEDGAPGEDGEPAKNVERRCNPERNRIEWRLEGETNWQVEYKLAEGQTCETETEG